MRRNSRLPHAKGSSRFELDPRCMRGALREASEILFVRRNRRVRDVTEHAPNHVAKKLGAENCGQSGYSPEARLWIKTGSSTETE